MKKFISFCKKFSDSVNESNAYAFAASAAYFIFLSFVPIVMLITSILPLTNLNISLIAGKYDDFIPAYLLAFLKEIYSEHNGTSIALISISAFMTLWVSGKGFWALMNGLNSAYLVKEKRNFVHLRIWGSLYTIIFIILIIFSLAIMVCGKVLGSYIKMHFPFLSNVIDFLLRLRFFYGWIILTFSFQLVYTFIPNVKLRFIEQLPGALFSSLGWTGFSFAFSIYIKYSGSFSMYGSLATIIITLFWLYYVMYILIIGAIINQFFRTFLFAYRKKKEDKFKDKIKDKNNDKNIDEKIENNIDKNIDKYIDKNIDKNCDKNIENIE